jgi:uncharacterized iron-regulated membrane protein
VNIKILTRKVHYWGSGLIVLPLLIIICTGLLLQVKKNLAWVQPKEREGSTAAPTLTLALIPEICRGVEGAAIDGWDDIARVEVRPSKGLVKVVSNAGMEVQLCAASGDVLQVAPRRSDLIESIHDGSWFHPAVKLWLFLPTGVVLLGLLLTGIYLFVLPFWARRKRAAASALAGR